MVCRSTTFTNRVFAKSSWFRSYGWTNLDFQTYFGGRIEILNLVNRGRPTSAAGRRVAAIAELSCRMPCLLYHAPCLPCAAQRWTPSSPLLSALPHSLFLAPPRLALLRAGAHVHHGRELSSLPLLCYTPPAKCRHQLGLPSLAAASHHRRSHPCARRTTEASPPP